MPIPPLRDFKPLKYKALLDMGVGESKTLSVTPVAAGRIVQALHRLKVCQNEGRRYSTERISIEPPTSRITRLV